MTLKSVKVASHRFEFLLHDFAGFGKVKSGDLSLQTIVFQMLRVAFLYLKRKELFWDYKSFFRTSAKVDFMLTFCKTGIADLFKSVFTQL